MTLRSLGTVAVLVGLLTSISACGESDADRREAYCQVVEEQQKPLTEVVAAGGPDALLRALPSFEELQDAAPPDLADEWEVVVQRLSDLRNALEDAGVDPADYDPENPPDGLTAEDRSAIEGAATGLSAPATAAALDAVQQQARDICKIPLFVS